MPAEVLVEISEFLMRVFDQFSPALIPFFLFAVIGSFVQFFCQLYEELTDPPMVHPIHKVHEAEWAKTSRKIEQNGKPGKSDSISKSAQGKPSAKKEVR